MAKTSNYIPMDSPIDRMNPMVKIYAIFCLGLSALIYPGFILGYVIVALLFVAAAIAGLLKKFSKFIFMFFVPIFVMLMFIQGLYSPKNVTVLAGMDADGKAAVLVSAYRSPAKTIRLEMKGAEERRFRISCLDESGDAPFDCGEEDGGLISLDLKSESAIFLLTEV